MMQASLCSGVFVCEFYKFRRRLTYKSSGNKGKANWRRFDQMSVCLSFIEFNIFCVLRIVESLLSHKSATACQGLGLSVVSFVNNFSLRLSSFDDNFSSIFTVNIVFLFSIRCGLHSKPKETRTRSKRNRNVS